MKYFIFFICFFPAVVFSQNATIDSLRKSLAAEPADTGKVNTLLNLGWQLMATGVYEKSISETEDASRLAKKLGFLKGEAASYFLLGSNYLYKGVHSKALDYYFKSLKMVEHSKDTALIAKHYSNIGNVYYSFLDYSNALIYYEKAYELAKAGGDKERAPLFLVNVANVVYQGEKDYNRALELYLQVLELYNKAGKNNNGKALVLGNIGNVLYAKKDYNKSLEYFFEALELAEKLNDKRAVESNSGNIGGVYIDMGNYKKAEGYLNQAVAIAKEIGDKEGLMYHTQSMSELHEKQKSWESSLVWYKKYIEIKDSIFNETKSKQIAEMQTRFDVEKKEKELDLFRQEKKFTKYKAYFLAVILLLVSLLATLLINRQRIKIKKQQEAHDFEQQLANAEIERSKLEKQNLEADLRIKQEKLSRITDMFREKSRMIDKMQEQLDKASAENGETEGVKSLLNSIVESIDPNEYWEEFITSFNLVNKNFFDQIQKKFPDLSRNELRLCALIKCNLGNKEIANILNITPDSVKKSRNRLRKRLQLEVDESLTKYIQFLN
jgi:tetratricopeptide (TPR) repeat protein